MRTTADLIQELEEVASEQGCTLAMLIVAWSDRNISVRSDDPDSLSTLDDAIEDGGEPVGLITLKSDGPGTLRAYACVLEEYKGEKDLEDFMAQLLTVKASELKATLGAAVTISPASSQQFRVN
jgi:hypothetical protein